jgi:ribokinase
MLNTKIVVVGSNMIDLITYIDRMPVEGETVEAPNFEMGFGGKGSNQAVAAARLGSNVNMITVVGNDNFGKQWLDNYNQNGINTSGVSVGTKSSGAAPIFVDTKADNRILIVKGANAELTPELLNQKIELIKGSKLMVLQQEIPLETNYHAIELANKLNVPVLLNPAPANRELNIDYVKKVDFFAPNETELKALTDMPMSSLEEVKAAAHHLVQIGVKNLIVTLGSRGVLWINKENEQLIESFHVKAVDTTGAGDAFIGSFAHYVTNGDDIPTALRHANQYAAVTVTRRGTQKSYPTAQELPDLIKSTISINHV